MCEQKSARPEPPFKVGDVVMLKSGGIPLTVLFISQDCVNPTCEISWCQNERMRFYPEMPLTCLVPFAERIPNDNLPF